MKQNNGIEGGVIIKENRMIKWEKKRKLGAWKYIFIYGLYFGGISIFPVFINFYPEYDLFIVLIFSSFFIIPIGITFGIFNWLVNEARYETYIEKNSLCNEQD